MTQTMPDRTTDVVIEPKVDSSYDARAERHDAATSAARERAARSLLGLNSLLSQRPELRGVHAPADLAADAIRWSA